MARRLPPPPSPDGKRDRRHTEILRKRDNMLTGLGGGAKSYYRTKAWSSKNHSILTAYQLFTFPHLFAAGCELSCLVTSISWATTGMSRCESPGGQQHHATCQP
jgi:hypothetical protein